MTEHTNWERTALEKMLVAFLKEQRSQRRWRMLWKLLFLGVWLYLLWSIFLPKAADVGLGKHVAIVKINGQITSEGSGSASTVIAALNNAFAAKNSTAIILRINSPGGSPVQANAIHDEMVRLREKHPNKPLYVVVDDLCASGGYYIAVAAEKIYVSPASIVGSIGVLMDGFGFTGLMEKLGVERRLITVGENKGFLDPFSPLNPQQKTYAKALMQEIQNQFIDVVRTGRGERLKETPEMFSGLFWSGKKAVALGLADGFGTADTVARDIVKIEDVVDYTKMERFPYLLKRFGMAVGQGVMTSLTELFYFDRTSALTSGYSHHTHN